MAKARIGECLETGEKIQLANRGIGEITESRKIDSNLDHISISNNNILNAIVVFDLFELPFCGQNLYNRIFI